MKSQPQKLWIIICTTIWSCYNYSVFVLFFAHLLKLEGLARSPPKFHTFFIVQPPPPPLKSKLNQFLTLWAILSINKQTNKYKDWQTINDTKSISSFFAKEVISMDATYFSQTFMWRVYFWFKWQLSWSSFCKETSLAINFEQVLRITILQVSKTYVHGSLSKNA